MNYDQSGTRHDIEIPFGDSLSLRGRVRQAGATVDGAVVAPLLVATVLDDEQTTLDTLLVSNDGDKVTIAGGDNIPLGTHFWSLRNSALGVQIAWGTYLVFERTRAA